MDFTMGAAGGSGDEQDNQKGKAPYRRHNADQTFRLEEIFSECPHPDERQRRQIASDLGLEPKQVKFWFQNKRTQRKTQTERANNNVLRVENERIHNENLAIKEALKNTFCPSCGGPPNCDEGHEHSLEELRLENARLKAEREKVSNFLAKYLEKPVSELELELSQLTPIEGSSSRGPLMGSSLKPGARSACMNLGGSTTLSFQDEDVSNPGSKITKMEKVMISQVAMAANEELLKLLCTDEPLWAKSSIDQKFVLHPECYEKIFPRIDHFENSKARVESSRDSRLVRINAMELVNMLLNPETWADLFPTIVTKAHTIEVVENGSLENRSGALLLMYEEMHVLSPLVPSREFYFLRHCQQLEPGTWVIADVSFDYMKENNHHPYSWKFPSGCIIHEISNRSCQVSWVEHVEVDEKLQTHQLYKDIVNNNIAYGAERRVMELQRMCERFSSVGAEYIPNVDIGGVMSTIGGMSTTGGRKSIVKLSLGMVKTFYGILNMSSKTDDFSQYSPEENSAIRISVRKNTSPSLSNAMVIVTASTSFWLPLPSQHLFDFFKDPIRRAEWDVMCFANPVHEIARISTGTHPSNYISIIQPTHPTTDNMVIIQESYIDHLGSYVVYSPINILDIKKAINGEDSSTMSIFPSGIVISEDRKSIANAQASSGGNGDKRTRGSLLTIAFQILMNSPMAMTLESVASVNSVITSTVKNINDVLFSDSNLKV